MKTKTNRKIIEFTVSLDLEFTKGSTKVTAGQKIVTAKKMIDVIAAALNKGEIVHPGVFGYFVRNACAKATSPKRIRPIFGNVVQPKS